MSTLATLGPKYIHDLARKPLVLAAPKEPCTTETRQKLPICISQRNLISYTVSSRLDAWELLPLRHTFRSTTPHGQVEAELAQLTRVGPQRGARPRELHVAYQLALVLLAPSTACEMAAPTRAASS